MNSLSRFSRSRGTQWLLLSILVVFAVLGCQTKSSDSSSSEAETETSTLVRVDSLTTLSPKALKARTPESFAALKPRVEHAVDVYRIVYRTPNITTGDTETVSGALFVPTVDDPVPTVSYQHGTIYPFEGDTKAPSNHSNKSGEVILCRLLASQGHVVIAPDYIGYGASSGAAHPYYLLESQTTTTWNGLRALSELEEASDMALDDRLVLTGYSQGGTVSMALHRRMQSQADAAFQLATSVTGGGAYHLPRFMDTVMAKDELKTAQSDAGKQVMNVYLWVLDTYLDHYDSLDRSWSDVVVSPYAAQLDTAQSVFDVDLPAAPSSVFREDFAEGLQSRRDSSMLRVLKENSSYEWMPKAPVRMVHGTADNIVPFANAQATVKRMRKRGVKTVALVPVKEAGHGDAFGRYLEVLVNALPAPKSAASTASASASTASLLIPQSQ